jgi:PAS domain S-box-containing protein
VDSVVLPPRPGIDLATLQRDFWETSSDLQVVTDRRGVLLDGNPAWRRVLGWSPCDQPGPRVRHLIHPDDVATVVERLGDLAVGGHFESVEMRLRDADGSYRWVSWSGVYDGRLWYATGREDCDVRRSGVDRADRAAGSAAEFWQATMDSMPGEVAVVDDTSVVIAVNEAWREAARRGGRIAGSYLGESYLDVCDRAGTEFGARRAGEGIRALLAGRQEPVVFDYALDDRWFTFTGTRFAGEGPARIVIAHTDVTERRQLEEESRARMAVIDELGVAVVGTDAARRVTRWSRGAELLYGWSTQEALGRAVDELTSPRPIMEADGDRGAVDGLLELSRKDGSTLLGHARWTQLHDADGRVSGTLGVVMDVSAQHRAQQDATTARNHLLAVTDSMSEGLFALGPDGGVTLMNSAAESMLGWSLAEIHGLGLHDITRHRESDGTTHRPEECPVLLAGDRGEVLQVEDDVFLHRDGIAVPVSYTVTPLKGADGDQGSVVVFMDATHVRAEQERLQRELSSLVWIQRVESALTEGRLLLHAQPIVDLASGAVAQHELLLRVREKDGSISPPAAYLSTAEEHGLIGDLDRWVIQQAVDHAAEGRAVEVNVSAASISDPDLLARITTWLAASGADPSLLVFEITETAVITDEEAGRRFVAGLHAAGCKVALDDFGTGYGGFTYLKQLEVDYLKIDVEFVTDLCVNTASRHVVEAVVNLARSFGLRTVAEGVEDAATLDLLTELGVDYAQGYHLGRPAPFDGPSSRGTGVTDDPTP